MTFYLICRFRSDNMHVYRPQTKFVKVMFSQVSVCPWGAGILHTPLPLGRHTSLLDTPWADTSPPSACWDTHLPAQCMLGYSPQAGSTHPTGMHSSDL